MEIVEKSGLGESWGVEEALSASGYPWQKGMTEMLKSKTQQIFSGKRHRINILGFAGHRVSVPIINSATVT